MRTSLSICAAACALICGMSAAACSQSPAAPSRTTTQSTVGDPLAALEPGLTAQGASFSPQDLAARGWTCLAAPFNPLRVSCSPPNQGHPVQLPGPPPPADRPATFTLMVFDNGVFIGTNLLIRSDLYNDQQCSSTDEPYRFIARIGYYECLHLPQGG